MTEPTLTTLDTGRTASGADSFAFTGFSGAAGVFTAGRESEAFNGSPSRSVCIDLKNGGVILESRPLIPDEDDDKREARA